MSDSSQARDWFGGWPASRFARGIAWAGILALPLLWQLGGTLLFDVDEGAFAEATREMLHSGDWGHTTLNGAPRFDKPLGVYWLQALSVAAFGLNEFALRLPSALSGLAMALALGAFAGKRWGFTAGALASVISVTSIGPLAIGRGATADALLNLLLVLAGLDLWRFIESDERAPLRRAYAWVGLGLLVKGPVALLVPGAAFVLACVGGRRWSLLRTAVTDWRGWVLLIGIAMPWYLYALNRHGMALVEGFLLRHNVNRFTGTIGGHRGTLLYYLVVLPLLSMPWAPLLVAVVMRWREIWRDPLGRFLLGWSGFVLVFFSLSATKLPHYVLYGYAPLMLLMARVMSQASGRLRVVVACSVVAWALLAAALPWLVLHFAPAVPDPLYRALLGGAPPPPWLVAACMLAAVLGILLWPGRADNAWRRPAAAAGMLALFISGTLLPWFGETLQGPVRHAAQVAASHGGPVVQWKVHLPSFAVYVGRVAPLRAPGPQDMALTRIDRVPEGDDGRPRLFEERGIVLLGPREDP
jgi:4-amino-4-deoxy-L-arabinose transferase-like glycosyltransferase